VRFRLYYAQIDFFRLFNGHHRAVEIGIQIWIWIGLWVGMNGNGTRDGRERGAGMREAEGVRGGRLDGEK
jgi:hypothetical protein